MQSLANRPVAVKMSSVMLQESSSCSNSNSNQPVAVDDQEDTKSLKSNSSLSSHKNAEIIAAAFAFSSSGSSIAQPTKLNSSNPKDEYNDSNESSLDSNKQIRDSSSEPSESDMEDSRDGLTSEQKESIQNQVMLKICCH